MSRADYVGLGLNPGGAQKVAPTGPTVFPPLTSEGIEPSITTLEHNATEGDRFRSRSKRGGRSYAGPLEGGVRPMSFGVLLTMAFGEPVSSVAAGTAYSTGATYTLGQKIRPTNITTTPYLFEVTTAGTSGTAEPTWGTTSGGTTNATGGTAVFTNRGPIPYVHTWNPKAAGKRPMPGTVWTVNQDVYLDTGLTADLIVDEYIGAMVDELAWTLEANNYLLYSSNIQAIRNLEDVTAPVVTMDTTELWSFDEVGAQISIPSISAGAYADFPIYDWGLSYGNSLTGGDRFRIGSKEIVRLRPGNVEATVSFTAAENLEAHYRRAIADRPELVKIKLDAKGRVLFDAVLAADDIYESLSIEVKAAEYTSGNIAISAEDTLEDLEVEANVVKDTSGQFLEVVLTNTHNGTNYVAPPAV